MAEHWPVLTVRQPWCWAIVHGGKPVENRSWAVRYRGPVWLHAGARSRWDPAGGQSPLMRQQWKRWLRASVPDWPGLPASDVTLGRRTTLMPFGAVVALAHVAGCHPSERCQQPPAHRFALPTFCSPWAIAGQCHVVLRGICPLPEAVPCKGALGLWRLPDEVEKAVREQLEDSRA
jgi:hypothetical protein